MSSTRLSSHRHLPKLDPVMFYLVQLAPGVWLSKDGEELSGLDAWADNRVQFDDLGKATRAFNTYARGDKAMLMTVNITAALAVVKVGVDPLARPASV